MGLSCGYRSFLLVLSLRRLNYRSDRLLSHGLSRYEYSNQPDRCRYEGKKVRSCSPAIYLVAHGLALRVTKPATAFLHRWTAGTVFCLDYRSAVSAISLEIEQEQCPYSWRPAFQEIWSHQAYRNQYLAQVGSSCGLVRRVGKSVHRTRRVLVR